MVLNRELRIVEDDVFLVHKPKGWTSFDVVRKLRGLFHVKKIGHAGTLDVMATGLLVVCTGKKTKEISHYMNLEKQYTGKMLLGATTESFDAETPVVEERSTTDISEDSVRSVFREFVGFQTQLPPMWSAVKVKGKRLHQYARKGIVVERKAREVYISSLVATDIQIPEVAFSVTCSKGTYVRTLVNDIGQRLGCGAYLIALERTRIGEFRLEDAFTIEDLVRYSGEHRGSVK